MEKLAAVKGKRKLAVCLCLGNLKIQASILYTFAKGLPKVCMPEQDRPFQGLAWPSARE